VKKINLLYQTEILNRKCVYGGEYALSPCFAFDIADAHYMNCFSYCPLPVIMKVSENVFKILYVINHTIDNIPQ
jgi:hypothetical protein